MILVRFSLSPWLPIPWVLRRTFRLELNTQYNIGIVHMSCKGHPSGNYLAWTKISNPNQILSEKIIYLRETIRIITVVKK